jgi:hypothetical protein
MIDSSRLIVMILINMRPSTYRKPAMKIGFTVGELEQHQMELSFDQPSGDLCILMDGIQVLQDSPALTIEPVKCYELSIGEQEKHVLAFQLTYGDETEIAGLHAIPRLSMMVSSIGEKQISAEAIGL